MTDELREPNQTNALNQTPVSPLERLAARGLAERRQEEDEAQINFFAKALRKLPPELVEHTKLICATDDRRLVRFEIAGQAFELETSKKDELYFTYYNLYHADLVLSEPIRALEDYSRERAIAAQKKSAAVIQKKMVIGAIGLTLIGYTAWMVAMRRAEYPGPTADGLLILIALVLGCGTLTLLEPLYQLLWQRWVRLGLKPVSAALKKGFEGWQSNQLEKRAKP